MALVKEFWQFMKVRKKFWLAPILIVLVALGTLMVISANAPVWAPFLYPFL